MEDLEETDLVLVYGTLMTDERNAEKLIGAELVDAEVKTLEHTFLMVQFNSSSSDGKFSPGVLEGGEFNIEGELYRVTRAQLDALDKLEQNGERYERKIVRLKDSRKAWMYVMIADDMPAQSQDLIETEARTQTHKWVRGQSL